MVKKAANSAYQKGEKLLLEKRPDEHKNLINGLGAIAPEVADYVIGFVYGEVWSREGLPLNQKAIATISALAAIGGAEPQLKSHIGGALKSGCTRADVIDTFIQIIPYAGFPRAINAIKAAQEVFVGLDQANAASVAPAARRKKGR
jgi:4-carboxymuconolactone decarboxylase